MQTVQQQIQKRLMIIARELRGIANIVRERGPDAMSPEFKLAFEKGDISGLLIALEKNPIIEYE